jgi:hypothetical protein
MSFADLNSDNSDYDRSDQADSAAGPVRISSGVNPASFFGEMIRLAGPYAGLAADRDRAAFLYAHLRSLRRRLNRAAVLGVAMLLAPLVCLLAPIDLRLPAFFLGLAGEFATVFLLLRAHRRWSMARKDYVTWLRLVHRRVTEQAD